MNSQISNIYSGFLLLFWSSVHCSNLHIMTGISTSYADLIAIENSFSDDNNSSKWNVSYHYSVAASCEENDRISCLTDCSQLKLYYADGCCKCGCRKNHILKNSTLCREASWATWNEWSKCIATEWGGIQMRERDCKSDGLDAPGSCSGRGSLSKTCSPVTAEFRIRKNVRDLTDEDLHDLLQGMTKFKKDNSKKGYRRIAAWHGFPGKCPWYHNISLHDDNHCSFHLHPLFQPWHRLIIVQFELGLQRHLKNKTLGIPYWNWAQQDDDLPILIRSKTIYDPILKKQIKNSFYGGYIYNGTEKLMFTHRKPQLPALLDYNYKKKGSILALLSHDYYLYDHLLSTHPHNQIHNCFCFSSKLMADGSDWCEYGLLGTPYSSWDPAFLLHHSAIDRLLTMRRSLEENAGVADWTKSRVIGQMQKVFGKKNDSINNAFEWPLSPFCNKSMNPEIITSREDVWTLHKSYYEESLFGYKYDKLDLGSYRWETLQSDFKRHNIDRGYWNDDLFVTEMGKMNYKFCANPIFNNKTDCQIQC